MTWQAYLCLGILALVLAGLIKNYASDALLLGALVMVTIFGIVTPKEALIGFSNPAMLTVAVLYVVAASLRETGAIDIIGSSVFGKAKSEGSLLLRLSAFLPALSAFLNNTPIVAMYIPTLTDWCKRHGVAPSRVLLPLSYLCIFGGTCTLIGTSTNLVVNGLMLETSSSNPELSEALRPMGFFELGYVGLPYAIIGITYMLTAGRHLLPSRKGLMEKLTESSRDYLVNMKIRPECRLIGKTVQDAGLRSLPGLFLIEIARADRVISPVAPDQILRENDILTFTGVVGTIVDLEKLQGLNPIGDEGYESRAAQRRGGMLCEAVVSPMCPSISKTIRDADFRALYNAAVVAVHRGGQRLAGKVGDIVLKAGDTLLLQTGPHFVRANRNNRDFLLVSYVGGSRPVRHDRVVYALLFLALLIVLMVSGVFQIVVAAALVAGLMVIVRCISVADARRSIDWRTLLTIGAAFGLSKALVNSGLVASMSDFIVDFTNRWGFYGVLASVYIMTSLCSAIVTNNASAAIIFPFALSISTSVGADPRPFIMAVAFAASASFITPMGYQTNLMVYGPGGYRFTDYIRVGLPLNLLLLVCATLLIPRVWPF